VKDIVDDLFEEQVMSGEWGAILKRLLERLAVSLGSIADACDDGGDHGGYAVGYRKAADVLRSEEGTGVWFDLLNILAPAEPEVWLVEHRAKGRNAPWLHYALMKDKARAEGLAALQDLIVEYRLIALVRRVESYTVVALGLLVDQQTLTYEWFKKALVDGRDIPHEPEVNAPAPFSDDDMLAAWLASCVRSAALGPADPEGEPVGYVDLFTENFRKELPANPLFANKYTAVYTHPAAEGDGAREALRLLVNARPDRVLEFRQPYH